MTDALPFVIGMVITFVLVRWIFYGREGGGGGGGPLPRGVMDQLSAMFPNIPAAVLRAEYVRTGSVPGAIERLLVLSPNYPTTAIREASRGEQSSLGEAPPKDSLAELLRGVEGIGPSTPVQVDSASWNKDRAVREQLLLQRKKAMLLKAREKFADKTVPSPE